MQIHGGIEILRERQSHHEACIWFSETKYICLHVHSSKLVWTSYFVVLRLTVFKYSL